MNTTRIIAWTLSAGIALSSSAAFAAIPDGWTDDFDAAKAKAAKEGKRLLVDFSGSDWCGWCKRLDKEVFAQEDFVSMAQKDFVLVLIDSPSDKSILSEKAAKQNPALVEKYNIHGFPSVLIMDAEGNTLYTTGYRPGGAKAYLKHLGDVMSTLAIKENLAKEINNLEKGSASRIEKIDAAMSGLDNDALEECAAYINELLENDTAGKYAAKYPYFSIVKPLEKKLRTIFGQMNREMSSKSKKLGRSPSKDDMMRFRAEVEAAFASRLAELKKEIDDARDKAPASVKNALDKLAKPIAQLIDKTADKASAR